MDKSVAIHGSETFHVMRIYYESIVEIRHGTVMALSGCPAETAPPGVGVARVGRPVSAAGADGAGAGDRAGVDVDGAEVGGPVADRGLDARGQRGEAAVARDGRDLDRRAAGRQGAGRGVVGVDLRLGQDGVAAGEIPELGADAPAVGRVIGGMDMFPLSHATPGDCWLRNAATPPPLPNET